MYEGKKPYGLVAFRIVGKDTDLEAASASLGAFSRLLHVLGYVKREIELGDELRPDSQVVRVEGGEVDVLESTDEERERLRSSINRVAEEPSPRPLSELKGLCLHLAWELKDLDRWFRHTDPAVDVRVEKSRQERERTLTDEEEVTFKKRVNELACQHDAETVRMYQDIYKGRIMNVYDELSPRGWFGSDDRDFFQNLDDPWEIAEVGNRLERVGEKLP